MVEDLNIIDGHLPIGAQARPVTERLNTQGVASEWVAWCCSWHERRNKRRIRNRMVYNDWGLYSFVQMLTYKCLHYGKELYIIDERDTTRICNMCKHKQNMPLWMRTYRCVNCGLVMDRDENSAINIYQRFVAWLGPHR